MRKNENFRGSEFSILPHTQNRKLGNLGKFAFTSMLVVFETQYPKSKNMAYEKENYNFTTWFNKKKMKIAEISEFSILPNF